MNEHQAGQGAVYDAFSGTQLDPSKWFFLEMPAPDGSMWRCEEPNARTELAHGACTLTVNRFERFHDVVQIMDNPKHLVLSTASFDIPANGSRRFSVDMSARGIDADRHDYRDACAAFDVLDMSSGIVFDFILTGEHVYALHEQLPFPSVTRPFSHMVESPMAGVRPVAGERLRCELDLDRAQGLVRWLANGTEIYRVQGAPIPESVKLGFGLLTLHPLHEGRSRSLKGQGLTATWSGFTVSEPTVTQKADKAAPKTSARKAAGKTARRTPAPSRANKRPPAPARKAAQRTPAPPKANKRAPAPVKKAAQRAPVSSRTRKGGR